MAWSVAFAQEIIWLSLLFMLSILVCLLFIIHGVTRCQSSTYAEYYLFKAPFQLQTGWILAAFVINLNVTFLAYSVVKDYSHANADSAVEAADASAFSMLLAVAILSFTFVFCASLFAAQYQEPQIIIVGVVSWALGGVAWERRYGGDEEKLVRLMFTETTRNGISDASAAMSIFTAGLVLILCAHQAYVHCYLLRGKSDESGNGDSRGNNGSSVVVTTHAV